MKRQRKPKSCLIVCNGTINKQLIYLFINNPGKRSAIPIISTDGASNKLYRLKIKPDYVVGDLDSIKNDVLKYFLESDVEIRSVKEQEHNDLEKAIMFALSKRFKLIYVIGFAGKRIDHTINNFSVLKKYYRKADIRFIDNQFEIFFAKKKIEFDYRIGELLSIQGIPAACGVTAYGLRYPLKNETLEFGKREGALNEAINNHIIIQFNKGDLLLFKKHFKKFAN
jgi:thiamine pyrophosphokinase